MAIPQPVTEPKELRCYACSEAPPEKGFAVCSLCLSVKKEIGSSDWAKIAKVSKIRRSRGETVETGKTKAERAREARVEKTAKKRAWATFRTHRLQELLWEERIRNGQDRRDVYENLAAYLFCLSNPDKGNKTMTVGDYTRPGNYTMVVPVPAADRQRRGFREAKALREEIESVTAWIWADFEKVRNGGMGEALPPEIFAAGKSAKRELENCVSLREAFPVGKVRKVKGGFAVAMNRRRAFFSPDKGEVEKAKEMLEAGNGQDRPASPRWVKGFEKNVEAMRGLIVHFEEMPVAEGEIGYCLSDCYECTGKNNGSDLCSGCTGHN